MGTTSEPEWKIFIEKAINQYPKENVIQVATVDDTNSATSPRVRSQIFRSFLNSPGAPNHPLLISTTDMRTPKVTQMISHSGIELVWWIPTPQQQYRITSKVLIVPNPKHALYKDCTDILQPEKLGCGSGIVLVNSEKFDWEAKRLEVWGNLSPYMRATLARPTPGSRMENPDDAKKWPVSIDKPRDGDSEETRRNWEYALGNFALVVIDPFEVDYVNMGVDPNTRTKYNKTSEGTWNSVWVVA